MLWCGLRHVLLWRLAAGAWRCWHSHTGGVDGGCSVAVGWGSAEGGEGVVSCSTASQHMCVCVCSTSQHWLWLLLLELLSSLAVY